MAIVDSISKVMGRASYTKPLVKLGKAFEKDPEGALGWVTVSSIIAKDGIGCVMYVTQSLNNKKIPDDKRRFVAALDLTNGLLMILAQIGMFFAMRKYSGPLFNKFFGKSFSEIAKSNTISRMRMQMAKTGESVAKKLKIEKAYNKVQKDGLDLFKFCADIAAATIIGKRVIVPLIATPMASKVEKWMNRNSSEDKTEEQNNNSNPSMKGKLDVVANDKTEALAYVQNESETTNLLERYAQRK